MILAMTTSVVGRFILHSGYLFIFLPGSEIILKITIIKKYNIQIKAINHTFSLDKKHFSSTTASFHLKHLTGRVELDNKEKKANSYMTKILANI